MVIKIQRMKVIFKKTTKNSKANKVYLQLNYKGGDSDSDHPVLIELPILFKNELDIPDNIIEQYKSLQNILEDTDMNYNKVLSEYGPVLASLFDDVPNDPQGDYQFKCYLSNIQVIGYDSECNKYSTYI